MQDAVGMVELNSIAQGIESADLMLKSADVVLLMSRPTCPGRYVIMISGETAAVEAAVQTGCKAGGSLLVDYFILAHLHEDVFPALAAANPVETLDAIGIIETSTIAASILAADGAAKAADVRILEVRMATGMAGKSYMTCTGSVSAVRAAVDAGVKQLGESGPVLVTKVIPSPDEQLKRFLM